MNKWNWFKDKEKEGELTEDEEKEFLKLRQSNHLAYDWVKKYSTHSITLPNGTVKNILRMLLMASRRKNGGLLLLDIP